MNDLNDRFSVLFKVDSQGRKIFLPWGIFGVGYVLPVTTNEEEVKNFLMLFYGVATILTSISIFLGMLNYKWYSAFLAFPILFFWYQNKIRSLLTNAEIITRDSKYYPALPSNIKSIKRLLIFILLINSIGGTANMFAKGFSIDDFLATGFSTFVLLLGTLYKWKWFNQ